MNGTIRASLPSSSWRGDVKKGEEDKPWLEKHHPINPPFNPWTTRKLRDLDFIWEELDVRAKTLGLPTLGDEGFKGRLIKGEEIVRKLEKEEEEAKDKLGIYARRKSQLEEGQRRELEGVQERLKEARDDFEPLKKTRDALKKEVYAPFIEELKDAIVEDCQKLM